ncbi:phosphotransferase family protein [Tenggerimyces flavus]|uniref:Phosphotransferase family protein n=1 Tax=Tenggerimyces flavus TaxID=1708749 RepID=A0ABV7YCG9_9ACTN|nr:aminoglycoside phosphotransferase family protein [Tenggerimyces flavus]MBM7788134.1 aminoglycoside phosphotransferase (APT) family kinase protein [Tenggerimyces flavus]
MELPRFGSDEEYAAGRNHPTLWLPVFRRALRAAGLSPDGPLELLAPSQYPTAAARDHGLVATVYPSHWGGFDAYRLELDAHALLEPTSLPIPRLVAHGTLLASTSDHPWPWLIETEVVGRPWSEVVPTLPPSVQLRSAAELGATLQRWHSVPHDHGQIVNARWDNFLRLVTEERDTLGADDDRLALLGPVPEGALHALAASTLSEVDTTRSTSLLHSDVHGGNVLLDPGTGALVGIIDFNEVQAGHAWYDLADACFRLLHGDPHLVPAFLNGYGLSEADLADGAALRLLGWGLLHDFDVLTPAAEARRPTQTSVAALALHLTGLGD